MLIINADDWGGNVAATDNSLQCFKKDRITSASAMVFMKDSQRAAELALEYNLDAGLHLNFSLSFNGNTKSNKLIASQQRIAKYLTANKYSFLLYNPLLRGDFHYVFAAQCEEYARLYKKLPTHIDGHHHLHLCTNILVDRLIPKGVKVRRNFTFSSSEKPLFNRFYRCMVDAVLVRRYHCTKFFFSLSLLLRTDGVQSIINLAKSQNVEVMVHPERSDEFDFLMSEGYFDLISLIHTGNFSLL